MRLLARSFLLAATLGVGTLSVAQSPSTAFDIGHPFPNDLVLTDAESGEPRALFQAHGGKKTLFIAYASW